MFKVKYVSISFIGPFLSNKRWEEISASWKAGRDFKIKNLEHRRHSVNIKTKWTFNFRSILILWQVLIAVTVDFFTDLIFSI